MSDQTAAWRLAQLASPGQRRHASLPLGITRHGWRTIGWLGVFSLCLVSVVPPPAILISGPQFSDKFSHLCAYGAVGWWMLLGWPRYCWWRVLAGLAALGLALELLQALTPERVASGWDEFANLLGVLTARTVAWLTPAGFPPFRRAE